jgi:uncharacterized protein YcnI
MQMRKVLALGGAALAVSLAAEAAAHVVVSPDNLPAGTFATVSFWTPEGCAGSPTTAVRIEIPKSVAMAKPQAKAGWRLELVKEPLAKPIIGEGGLIKERVAAVVWRGGPVPDDQFEQFTVLIRTPGEAGPVYFPALQTCEKGEARWAEIPSADTAGKGLAKPAPVLKVTPAAHGAPHH